MDTGLAMFDKIVAIPLPSYFEHPEVYTCHMHSLSYRQIHTSVCYYKYSFFPIPIVLWNRLPADLVLQGSHRLDLESFLEKSLKTRSALKSTGKSLKGLEKSLNSTIFSFFCMT